MTAYISAFTTQMYAVTSMQFQCVNNAVLSPIPNQLSLTIWEAALVIAIRKCNDSAAILIRPPDGPIWQADCVACIQR